MGPSVKSGELEKPQREKSAELGNQDARTHGSGTGAASWLDPRLSLSGLLPSRIDPLPSAVVSGPNPRIPDGEGTSYEAFET